MARPSAGMELAAAARQHSKNTALLFSARTAVDPRTWLPLVPTSDSPASWADRGGHAEIRFGQDLAAFAASGLRSTERDDKAEIGVRRPAEANNAQGTAGLGKVEVTTLGRKSLKLHERQTAYLYMCFVIS